MFYLKESLKKYFELSFYGMYILLLFMHEGVEKEYHSYPLQIFEWENVYKVQKIKFVV